MTSKHGVNDKNKAMAKVVKLLTQGHTVVDAMRSVDRTVKCYEVWRTQDSAFAEAANQARAEAKEALHWSNLVEDGEPRN